MGGKSFVGGAGGEEGHELAVGAWGVVADGGLLLDSLDELLSLP
jgi:hypothetical protein